MRIFIRHTRCVKYCSTGGRAFFKKHNLCWSTFLKEGLPVEAFAHIDDAMLNKVIQAAEMEQTQNG